jgi:hypothetical protein
MSIINPADFTGEVNIPNSDDAYTGVSATVQSLIDEYEPELLTEILGATLYAELLAGLPVGVVSTAEMSTVVTGVNTAFTTMFQIGDTITINGETHEIATINNDLSLNTIDMWSVANINQEYYGKISWITLRNKVKPLILKYTYYQYLDNNIVQSTGIGTQATTSEAGNRASAWGKQVKQWNKMSKGIHELVKFLTGNVDYPDYKAPAYYCFDWAYNYDYYLGCYGYIVPEVYRFKNSLGL